VGGEAVQAGLPFRGNESSGRKGPKAARRARRIEEGVPKIVIVEDSVHIRSEHAPVRADGSVG